jgi:hypothetical protein
MSFYRAPDETISSSWGDQTNAVEAAARDTETRPCDMELWNCDGTLERIHNALTTIIPIVGAFSNPVETGIVASLAPPGGNITGITPNVGLAAADSPQAAERRAKLASRMSAAEIAEGQKPTREYLAAHKANGTDCTWARC